MIVMLLLWIEITAGAEAPDAAEVYNDSSLASLLYKRELTSAVTVVEFTSQ